MTPATGEPIAIGMSETTTKPRDYRDTVFLPNTPFPMRGDLPKREPEALIRWADMDLWARMRADRAGSPPFILHDGPPYANGHLHIGHALNKILKDVINRAQRMAGRDANYIPGWDCHGLPIEWKVEEQYRKTGRDKDAVPILQFRAECRAYAAEWMAVQAQEFWRLGIAGDWDGRYATMDFKSEASIASEIGRFLMNGSLYRGLRPVMWSTVEKTALAEAEVEYHDRTSDTVYVRVRLKDGPGRPRPRFRRLLDDHAVDGRWHPRRDARSGHRLRPGPRRGGSPTAATRSPGKGCSWPPRYCPSSPPPPGSRPTWSSAPCPAPNCSACTPNTRWPATPRAPATPWRCRSCPATT